MTALDQIDPQPLSETDEQRQLRAVLRDFFSEASGPEDIREELATPRGYDTSRWARLAGEIGVHGLAVPEEYGGSGGTFAELAVALEESGRTLYRGPLLPTVVLAAHALLAGGDRATCERYLPRIADGTLTGTVAGFDADDGAPGVAAERSGAGWVLRGRADFVLDGAGADLILVRAATPAGPRLFACEPASAADTCRRTPRRVLDETRRQALVEFRGTPAIAVGTADHAGETRAAGSAGSTGGAEPDGSAGSAEGADAAVSATLDTGRAALAAEQVGGSGHALEATVEFVTQRHQFGRPIGSFQAVEHRLADVLVALEGARSAAAYAAACAAVAPARLPVAAGAAAVVCRRPSVWRRPSTCSSTAASASPGSIPRIFMCAGRAAPRCCSAPPITTVSGSPGSRGSPGGQPPERRDTTGGTPLGRGERAKAGRPGGCAGTPSSSAQRPGFTHRDHVTGPKVVSACLGLQLRGPDLQVSAAPWDPATEPPRKPVGGPRRPLLFSWRPCERTRRWYP